MALHNATAQVYSVASNFSVDLLGTPDTRPGTWGTADSVTWRITFNPPHGKRVRILRVYGDFLIWPKGPVERGKFAGALFGLQTTGPEGSVRADLAADNTFLYIQTATGGEPARAAFDHDVCHGGLLGPDHTLVVKVAIFLNDTGREIHCEPTFVTVFRWEDETDQSESAGACSYSHACRAVPRFSAQVGGRAGILVSGPQR